MKTIISNENCLSKIYVEKLYFDHLLYYNFLCFKNYSIKILKFSYINNYLKNIDANQLSLNYLEKSNKYISTKNKYQEKVSHEKFNYLIEYLEYMFKKYVLSKFMCKTDNLILFMDIHIAVIHSSCSKSACLKYCIQQIPMKIIKVKVALINLNLCFYYFLLCNAYHLF